MSPYLVVFFLSLPLWTRKERKKHKNRHGLFCVFVLWVRLLHKNLVYWRRRKKKQHGRLSTRTSNYIWMCVFLKQKKNWKRMKMIQVFFSGSTPIVCPYFYIGLLYFFFFFLNLNFNPNWYRGPTTHIFFFYSWFTFSITRVLRSRKKRFENSHPLFLRLSYCRE